IDSERDRLRIAEPRVDSVRGDDEVVATPLGIGRIALGTEVQRYAELACAVLQDFEQALAADADEAVPARGDGLAAEVDVDVVPMRELGCDDRGGRRVVGLQVFDGLVGEDDAPSEGHSGRVALEYLDSVRRIAQLHRDGEIESR